MNEVITGFPLIILMMLVVLFVLPLVWPLVPGFQVKQSAPAIRQLLRRKKLSPP